MFHLDWLGLSPKVPPFSPANPGRSRTIRLVHSKMSPPRTETFDLPRLLSHALDVHGLAHKRFVEVVQLRSGFALRPRLVRLERTPELFEVVTTIETSHPNLLPRGLFEFQTATAVGAESAFLAAFSDWITVDLPVLEDLHKSNPDRCEVRDWTYPHPRDGRSRRRRIVAGQPVHRRIGQAEDDPHPTPEGLFSVVEPALGPLVEREDPSGIRLYVNRGIDGDVAVECRVDGIDWPDGKRLLEESARTWPEGGIELRKQYVVLGPAAMA